MGVPAPITPAMLLPANANIGKPRYDSMTDWGGGIQYGGDPGLPVVGIVPNFTSATVSLASASGGAPAADYTPRNQNAKRANIPGQQGVIDITRNRGAIAPGQRYPLAADAALPAPVVTSLTPNTAVHGAQPLIVLVNGTGFTPGSLVITGGSGSPWDLSSQYVSPTQMRVAVDPRYSIAGNISVAVVDHSVMSNTDILFAIT